MLTVAAPRGYRNREQAAIDPTKIVRKRPPDMLIDTALCEELFHTATGTAFADILVMVTGKPGRFAASGFGVDCAAAHTVALGS
jgi:hypothetical protein